MHECRKPLKNVKILRCQWVKVTKLVLSKKKVGLAHYHFLLLNYLYNDLLFLLCSRWLSSASYQWYSSFSLQLFPPPITSYLHPCSLTFYPMYFIILQGVSGLARKFGLTPDQLGENLRDNYQRHETEQHPVEPDETAENYLSR